MELFNFTTNKPSMGGTKTYEDFAKFLGAKPHRLGMVSRQYKDLTASYLTEALQNIYSNTTSKGAGKYQNINSLAFEWEIDNDYIKRVEFAAAPTGDGLNGSDIIMAFKERYYEKYDAFRIEGSRQMVVVVQAPIRKADNYWEVVVRLQTNDLSKVLDPTACAPGMQTRFITNYHPEMSEEGYTKYQSNVESYRNHISFHRCDVTFSGLFAALEDTFVTTAGNKGKGELEKTVFKMKTKEKELFDNFLDVRNNALLMGKSTMDKNGKSTITDPATGRPLIIGDGIIAQIERYADKYAYAKMTSNVLDTALERMRQKSRRVDGNQYVFIVNSILWNQIQRTLRDYLKAWQPTAGVFFSQKTGGYVTVGTTFDSYIFAGNQITFKVDRALSLEYGNKGYGVCIDLTPDESTGSPAMQMFTLGDGGKGAFQRAYLKGVGGLTGLESGEVSSPVAASRLIHYGYAGVAVFNPFKSFILEENV